MNTMMLWNNPLVVRGVRSRLRPHLALSWALVTIVASTFLYVWVPNMALKDSTITKAEATREAILPLLMMQGIILMVMGTGAVAGGMARERTYRLLDYQRLTPMSPSAKIVGMLIGLPIREYFMFAVSLPFVFYAAWVGGLSFGILLKFYLVFVCSAVVYHMTGLVAGMIVDKPWRAGTVSQGLIVILYLFLPQVSHLGFTFFEFLTARPVFYGLMYDHLLPDVNEANAQFMQQAESLRYESVAFFGMKLPPTFFSLAVQAYALLSLYVIIYRKWQGETRLPFSKGYAILFFAIAQLFLIGSVQPFLNNDKLFEVLAKGINDNDPSRLPATMAVFSILLVTLLVSGAVAALALHLCTPGYHQSVLGLRRAKRRGDPRLAWSDDAATSLPLAIAFVLIAWLGFIAVYQTALSAGRLQVSNSIGEIALLLAFFAVVLLTIQQVREQFVERVFVMAMFIFWLVPFLTMIVLWSAFNESVLALYAAIPFPATGLYLGSGMLVSDLNDMAQTDIMLRRQAAHAQLIVNSSVVLYAGVLMLLLLRSRRRWRRIQTDAGGVTTNSSQDRSTVSVTDLDPSPAYATINSSSDSATPRQ